MHTVVYSSQQFQKKKNFLQMSQIHTKSFLLTFKTLKKLLNVYFSPDQLVSTSVCPQFRFH